VAGLPSERSLPVGFTWLKDRLIAAVDYFNRDPVVHTWTYKLDKAA
jgi:hypothetical protein